MKIIKRSTTRILAAHEGIWYAVHIGDADRTGVFYGPTLTDGFIDDPFVHVSFAENPETFVPRFFADPLTILMEHLL